MTSTTLRLELAAPSVTPSALIMKGWAGIQLLRARARQRKHLARLDAAQLDDLGISQSAALAESSKPFWKK